MSTSVRPAVDVVVPFVGSRRQLEEVLARMAVLQLRGGDSLVIVDNTPEGLPLDGLRAERAAVVNASSTQTPGFARNRGAARGAAPWLVFLDADTAPAADLLDRYFEPAPRARTALLAGGLRDQHVPPSASAAPRYAYLSSSMSQEDTMSFGEWAYPKSANLACRRCAFEEVDGFREDFRAAEDADLTYRLRALGWDVERREAASVVHFGRQTVLGLLKQRAIWGAGGAGIDRLYPGALPARRRPGLVWWAARTISLGLIKTVSRRNRDAALRVVLEPLEAVIFELGRSLPNERPLTLASWWRAVRRLVAPRTAPRR